MSEKPRVLHDLERQVVRRELEARGFVHRPAIGDWVKEDVVPHQPRNDAARRVDGTDEAPVYEVQLVPAWLVWDGVHEVIHVVVKPPAHLLEVPARLGLGLKVGPPPFGALIKPVEDPGE